MSTKKAELRDKINNKTKSKPINKSSNNKIVKKTSKIKKNITSIQKKEPNQKKQVEIKLIKDQETSMVIQQKVKNQSIKNKTKNKKITKHQNGQKKIKEKSGNIEEKEKQKEKSVQKKSNNKEIVNPEKEKTIIKEKRKKAERNIQSMKTKKIDEKNKDKRKTLKLTLNKIIEFLRRKKYYIFSFIITIILIIVLIFVLPNSDEKILFSFKEYELGTKVTLSDNSIWYVVEDSSSEKSKVTLLSEKVLDINKDKKINDKDKVVYDKDNKCLYDTKKEKNIGYFLENDVKEMLKTVNGISEIRLLTSEEYINIRKTMDFGYDWKEGNWLASESLDSWWLETSRYNKIYTVTKRGSYKLSEAKSKNYIRPVIKVDKSSIK